MIRNVLLWTVCLCLPYAGVSQSFPVLTFHKFFDNFGEDYPIRLVKARDGALLLGGHTVTRDSARSGCGNVYFLKVDTLGSVLWEREINMSGCEELRDVIETEDGGLMFSAITTSLIPNPERGNERYWSNLMVGKVDAEGQVAWLRSYGGSNQDQGFELSAGEYHDYLICGFTHSNNGDIPQNEGQADVWTLSIDNQGEIRSSQTFGGAGNDWALSASRCSNGDILLAGYTDSPDLFRQPVSPFGNGLLIRLTPQGTVRWMRPYPCPQGGQFNTVSELPNGKILLGGHCRSSDREQRFWWLLLSAEGLVIHEHLIEGPQPGVLTGAIACDQGYLLGGYTTGTSTGANYAKGGEDFWLVKLNEDGHVMWKNTYGGPDDERCMDIIEYRPGVYYALGQKINQFTRENDQNRDFWLIRIEEKPADSIQGSIWVRMEDNRIYHQKPTRFSARVNHGDRFLWDFGDGTTSTEAHPLKTYDIPGLYDVTLTIFVNEHCRKVVTMPKPLEVW